MGVSTLLYEEEVDDEAAFWPISVDCEGCWVDDTSEGVVDAARLYLVGELVLGGELRLIGGGLTELRSTIGR